MKEDLYLRKGHEIRDPDGNLFCTLVCDVYRGQRHDRAHVVLASTGKHPTDDDAIPAWLSKLYMH